MMSYTAKELLRYCVVYPLYLYVQLQVVKLYCPPPPPSPPMTPPYIHIHTQEKRSIFPRFYFVGDDDLLEILGQATNPNVIQSHLKKLFAGIHTVEFEGEEEKRRIVAMRSLEGEVVPLKEPVPISADVEVIGSR